MNQYQHSSLDRHQPTYSRDEVMKFLLNAPFKRETYDEFNSRRDMYREGAKSVVGRGSIYDFLRLYGPQLDERWDKKEAELAEWEFECNKIRKENTKRRIAKAKKQTSGMFIRGRNASITDEPLPSRPHESWGS